MTTKIEQLNLLNTTLRADHLRMDGVFGTFARKLEFQTWNHASMQKFRMLFEICCREAAKLED